MAAGGWLPRIVHRLEPKWLRTVDEDLSVVSHFDVELFELVRHSGAEVRVRMINSGEGKGRAVLSVVARTIGP